MATGGNRQPNPSKAVAPERREVRLCPGLGQHPDTGTGSPGGRSQPQVERRDHVQTACSWGDQEGYGVMSLERGRDERDQNAWKLHPGVLVMRLTACLPLQLDQQSRQTYAPLLE